MSCLAYQHEEPVQRIFPIALAGSEAMCLDGEDAIVIYPPPGDADQPSLHMIGEGWRAPDVETQLDCGCDLVNVLAAGTRGANESLRELRRVDVDGRGNGDHPCLFFLALLL
jgi:hypothetical protein